MSDYIKKCSWCKACFIRLYDVCKFYIGCTIQLPDNKWPGYSDKTMKQYKIIDVKLRDLVDGRLKCKCDCMKEVVLIIKPFDENMPTIEYFAVALRKENMVTFPDHDIDIDEENDSPMSKKKVKAARLRSEIYASIVCKYYKGPHQHVLTLDGALRNINALRRAGIPDKNIHLIENNPCAFVTQMLAIRCSINIHLGKIETYLNKMIKLQKKGKLEILAAYVDFCTYKPSSAIRSALNRSPFMQVCALTQSKRVGRAKITGIDFLRELKGFKIVYNKDISPSVRCYFYEREF